MKTYKDYLIDFETLKVGDKVYSLSNGYGKVVYIKGRYVNTYPICVSFNEGRYDYTEKGKRNLIDINPEIYSENPDFFKEKKEIKLYTFYVSDGEKSWLTRIKISEQEAKEQFSYFYKYEKIDCTEITEVVYE
jgi:hypothetical protein